MASTRAAFQRRCYTFLLYLYTESQLLHHLSQAQQKLAAFLALAASSWKICDIRVCGQCLCNLLAGLNPSDHDQTISRLRHSLRNSIGRLSFSLSPDDVRLSLLLRLLDNEARPLGVLLGNLLLLDGAGEFLSEGHVRDGDVLESDVELLGTLEKVGADAVADGLTLRDELGGIELGDDGFEDFVSDGWEDTLVVILSEVLSNSQLQLELHRLCFHT